MKKFMKIVAEIVFFTLKVIGAAVWLVINALGYLISLCFSKRTEYYSTTEMFKLGLGFTGIVVLSTYVIHSLF